ncbi:MAG TPA: hypothetical protein PK915_06095 [Bacteroidales bacterium]|nr:hypothetical protein [Bacteroidales bacterium]
MKKINLFLWVLLFGVISCGKPHDPESLVSPDSAGGYVVISRFATPASAQDVIVDDSMAFIAQGEGGLVIVDVTDPGLPDQVSVTSQDVRGYSTRIAKRDSVVYIAAGTYGVTVINVSDVESPFVTVSNLGMKPARNLYLFGDYLFTAVSELGVKIATIVYPTFPDVLGEITTAGYAYGVTTSPDSNLVFIANGEMGISVFDISDFAGGYGPYPLVTWTDMPGYAESVVLNEEGNIAFLACGNSGVQVVDVSDTTNLQIIGGFYYSGYAKALIYKNDRIYLAARRGGLQIINVADPYNPSLIGWINSEGAMGLDVQINNGREFIYVADELEGLIIVSSQAD